MLHLLTDILRDTVLICGIVIIMMMMIESFNLASHSKILGRFSGNSLGQIGIATLLGCIPGCIGGFAVVSLYNRRLMSFGALTAMMIASCGDEAFFFLAMMPSQAILLFVILACAGFLTGMIVDTVWKKDPTLKKSAAPDSALQEADGEHVHPESDCGHPEHCRCHSHSEEEAGKKSACWQRITVFVMISAFIVALSAGWLEHGHGSADSEGLRLNLLGEWWLNLLFAVLSIALLIILWFKDDNFIKETIWNHIVKGHLPGIFAWTFGILLLIGILGEYVDIRSWVSNNTILMILLATAIGIIPESGPHMIFIALYASGIVPLPVLLASCVSQSGHTALPLLAENKRAFIYAKSITCIAAIIIGFIALLRQFTV